MQGNHLARGLSAAVLAGALTTAGCASAATKTTATTTTATKTSTTGAAGMTTMRAPAPAGGDTHIVAYSINSDGPYLRAILTGAVGDYGPGVTVYPDGKVDPQHTHDLELKLSRGSFRLSIAGIDQKIIRAYQHWPGNAGTCSGSISFTAAAPVVGGSGTGRYQGISGSFTMTVTIDEVDAKPACDGTGRFLSQVILMTGSATVSF